MITTTEAEAAKKPKTNILEVVSIPGLVYFLAAALSIVLVLLLTASGPKEFKAMQPAEGMTLIGP